MKLKRKVTFINTDMEIIEKLIMDENFFRNYLKRSLKNK